MYSVHSFWLPKIKEVTADKDKDGNIWVMLQFPYPNGSITFHFKPKEGMATLDELINALQKAKELIE